MKSERQKLQDRADLGEKQNEIRPQETRKEGGEMKEKDLTKQIRSLLKVCGIWHWKAWQGLGSTPGVPDILGIYKGRMLGIEVKTAAGKLSKHQQDFIDKINAEGGIAFVARSIEDVAENLEIKNRVFFQGRY